MKQQKTNQNKKHQHFDWKLPDQHQTKHGAHIFLITVAIKSILLGFCKPVQKVKKSWHLEIKEDKLVASPAGSK